MAQMRRCCGCSLNAGLCRGQGHASSLWLGQHPPFHALVLAEEFNSENPTSDVIEECMRRLGVADVSAVAKVSTRAKGLVDAMKLGCGWKVLLDSGSMTTDQIAALGPDIIVNLGEEVSRATRHRVGRRNLQDPSAPPRPLLRPSVAYLRRMERTEISDLGEFGLIRRA